MNSVSEQIEQAVDDVSISHGALHRSSNIIWERIWDEITSQILEYLLDRSGE